MTLPDILELVRREFGPLADKFTLHELPLAGIPTDRTAGAANPGVYLHLNRDGVVKVGRHLANSRKRAFEHIGANTGGTMQALLDDPSARVALFNVAGPADLHWVCALEVFLERSLKPAIRSARLG